MSSLVATRRRLRLAPGSVAIHVTAAIFVIVTLLPIYYIFLSSIVKREDLFTIPINYWPARPTLSNYQNVMASIPVARYFWNTVVIATTSSLVTLAVSLPAAYAFSRVRFPGRDFLLIALLVSGLMPAVATIIPLFDVYQRLSLIDTMHGLLILYVGQLLPFSVWVLTSFYRQVPEEIEEAARIDGAGILALLGRVVLPLMKPGIATIFIIDFIVFWNEFLFPLVFSRSDETRVLTLGISEVATIFQYYIAWENVSAMGVLIVLPVFLLALFFQRQITEGLMAGALK